MEVLVPIILIAAIFIFITVSIKKGKQKNNAVKEVAVEENLIDNDKFNLWKSRIENNAILQEWINEATSKCEKMILTFPERDQEFEFLAYEQDFVLGINLQEKYLQHLQKTIHINEPIYILEYNFTRSGLLELKGTEEINNFAKAFSEQVKDNLKAKGYNVSTSNKIACLSSNEELNSLFNEYYENRYRYIHYIKYTRIKVNAEW